MPSITVAAYNIRRGRGMDGRVDLARIAGALGELGADVVVLNEVQGFSWRGRRRDQARVLGELTGMRSSWFPAISLGFYHFGNAILTREAPRSARLVRLPRIGRREAEGVPAAPTRRERAMHLIAEPRSAGIVTIDVDGHEWAVAGTHLGLTPAERRAQCAVLARELTALGPRTVLAGDLNAVDRGAEDVAPLIRWGAPLGPALFPTFPSTNPREQRDYIIPGPSCAIISAKSLSVEYSDHLPVVAVISQQESSQ